MINSDMVYNRTLKVLIEINNAGNWFIVNKNAGTVIVMLACSMIMTGQTLTHNAFTFYLLLLLKITTFIYGVVFMSVVVWNTQCRVSMRARWVGPNDSLTPRWDELMCHLGCKALWAQGTTTGQSCYLRRKRSRQASKKDRCANQGPQWRVGPRGTEWSLA